MTGPGRLLLGATALLAVAALGHRGSTAIAARDVGPRHDAGGHDGPLADIRVGLATDLDSVGVCCDRRLTLAVGDRVLRLERGIEVRADPSTRGRAAYRLQVAALKDERQAEALARRLGRQTGLAADALFDADRDLYRVRIGHFKTAKSADKARGRLSTLGVDQAWLVSEGGALEDAGLLVEQGGRRRRVAGRWLAVEAPKDVGIPFGRGRYRSRLLIYLNDRGKLNVINELSIEDYLRGVVPREMGPELYNQLEALKAQSVAARTFTLRNLGEFAAEGYDICSTPRCQVYGGMGVEHPRSDRAIAETASEVVLIDGAPAEIFYSATCGGHTENVEIVFPEKRGDHLRGVPCFEAGALPLDSGPVASTSFASALVHELLPPPPGRSDRSLAARLEHLALIAALPLPSAELTGLDGESVHRFLASFLDLALDTRLLGDRQTLADLVERPPPDLATPDRRLAGRLTRILYSQSGPIADDAIDELLFELARYLGALPAEPAGYLRHDSDAIVVKIGGTVERLDRAERLITGRLTDTDPMLADIVPASLQMVPGDRLEIYRHRDRLLAVAQPPLEPPIRLGRRAELASWRRNRSRDEVRKSVQTRYPGFPFDGFQVLGRGVSGRVSSLRLLGTDGRSLLVDGLAVRWTLDLPDTWFRAEPTQTGWVFDGNGWGHGVGLCQAGSFGMAARGADHRRILEHYFTGIRLGRPTSWTAESSEVRFERARERRLGRAARSANAQSATR